MTIKYYCKVMGISLSLLLVSCSVFKGATVNESDQVIPLTKEEVVEQQLASVGLQTSLASAKGFSLQERGSKEYSFHSEVEFFETVVSYGQSTDPRIIFALTNGYITSNQYTRGIAFFERLMARYRHKMNDDTYASYLAGYAILRGLYAEKVPVTSRIGWVRDTFDVLDEAKKLSKDESPVVHWAAGMIYAQVPSFFFKKEQAYEELNWLIERPEAEIVNGFYREVYHQLAKLYERDGQHQKADEFLKKSGYDSYTPKVPFMGWFTTQKNTGATMSASLTLDEVIEGRVYSLYGFGFSDIHFMVSDDGKETIAIDAGTHPFSLQAAHQYLLSKHPDLPPVTTAIITHTHWDHIGGLQYLLSLNPELTIYGRGNYHGTLDRIQRNHSYTHFRGDEYQHDWVEHYKPTHRIESVTKITIGGMDIELIPTTGGETEDALLAFMPASKIMFVGDILMPFYGEPWVEEGFIDEAVMTMDKVLEKSPNYILHGHRPLSLIYGGHQMKEFREAYVWLVDSVRKHVKNGYSVKNIVRLNLIPPGLENKPEVYFSYFAARDHLIARTADKMVGIWQEDITGQEPEGLDNLTAIEYGRLLDVYLDLSVNEVSKAIDRILDGGDNELALKLAVAAEQRYGNDASILLLKEEAADRLRSAAQFFDPFKFTVYSEMIGIEHKPIINE